MVERHSTLDHGRQHRVVVGVKEASQLRVHASGLLEAASQDSDFDAWLEDQVEHGRDGSEEGLAAASVGPDNAVRTLVACPDGAGGFGCVSEERKLQVVKWSRVAFDQRGSRHANSDFLHQPRVEVIRGLERGRSIRDGASVRRLG
jgi:hypothetical protein